MPCRRFLAAIFVLTALLPFASLASEADALAISQAIQQRHLPYGTVMDPVYSGPTSNVISNYTRCGDSAIWTGHYLAAEAFRYNATGSADALRNVNSAIAGIETLVDVTGTDLLARCRFPANSPYAASIIGEEQHNGIYLDQTGTDDWVGNTSRDQYSGVFFGLSVAYDMVDDAGVRSAAATLITRMLDFLRSHLWTVFMPDGTVSTTFVGRADQQLSFMNVGLHVNPEHYAGAAELSSTALAASTPVPIALEVTDNSSYFKFNLDNINLYNLIRLDSSSYHSIYVTAYDILWNHVGDQQNAFFNMINRALNSADSSRDSSTVSMLDQWLLRPSRDVYVDLTSALPSCGSGEACQPVPVAQRPTTDFLWQRDPFQLTGGGQGTVESAGIDYILPYWMARYYGIETSAAVVNAATGGTLVASESIASLYAPGLADSIASAGATPLPTTLGGTSVLVRDSAGVTRAAPLFYVSPTQINFQIPPGTALGQAQVTASNSSNSALAVTTVMVTVVAPGLFAAVSLAVPDSQEYLVLYGTGIANRSSLSNVAVTIGGTAASVTYAGAQGYYAGLDQVNVAVPASLRGTASAPLSLTVDGYTANVIQVAIP